MWAGTGRTLVICVAGVAVAATLVACGSTSATGATRNHVAIAVLNATPGNYTISEDTAAEATASADDATVTTFDANSNPQSQLTQCKDAITSGRYQAILLESVTSASAVPCVLQATSAGLKVVGLLDPIGPESTAALQIP